jgi:hypothetical protein
MQMENSPIGEPKGEDGGAVALQKIFKIKKPHCQTNSKVIDFELSGCLNFHNDR